ncbi:Uncharacterised protein [Mycobacteroides abscessus subsp. abscessus]|nr:Uncharacterised protein [Mycobacteroides abscessus subsp. abscessus]
MSLTCLPASLRNRNADLALTALAESYSSSVISVNGFLMTLPTVLMAISGRPTAATVSANSLLTASPVVRSPWNATAFAPAVCTAATVSSAASLLEGLL